MVNRDRVQAYRVHEAQNRQQGRVRTRVATIHANPFVQRMDSGIASAAKSQLWQSPDKDDDQGSAGIFHVACPGKDMPVFANAVIFAVAASGIAAAGTDVNGMPQVCVSCRAILKNDLKYCDHAPRHAHSYHDFHVCLRSQN